MGVLKKSGVTLEEDHQLPGLYEVWKFPSKSRPGEHHYTFRDPAGNIFCTCEGFKYQDNCWHINKVEKSA